MSQNNERKVIHSLRTEVDSFGRKKYKLQEVVHSNSEQQENHSNAIVDTGRHKSMLIAREQGLNIDKYIGKIETNKKKKTTEVFYCDVCSEGFKCDMAYLTHLNSPAHNRKLGMNMKVKNVSLQTVSSKIQSLINKKLHKAQQQQERQIIKAIEANQSQPRKTYPNKRPPPPPPPQQQSSQSSNQNQPNSEQQNHQDQEINPSQFDIKDKQQQSQQQQKDQDQQDSNQMAEMEMMKQMGFANSFGNKKHKR